jgi:alkylhydroperoxidase family enzyme
MAADKGVSEATFKSLAEHFNPRKIVELTITAGFYAAAARVTRALDVKLEPGAGDEKSAYGKC